MLNVGMVRKAKKYLSDKNDSGVALFFDAEIYGWKDKVRNPESEKPNAIAIDANGNQWVAKGGDDYNGAKEWVQISCV